MNLSIQDEFHLFAEELQRHLSPDTLQQLAQETGFVKRKSKYGGFMYLDQSTCSKRFSYSIM
ncbi:Mobile element protein [Bacillus cereus]|nr:Mobile element protein [Bacillus cereus]